MWVKLARPEWDRSCADCQKYIYEEDGRRKVNRRTGLLVLNASGMTDCCACPKISDRVFDEAGNEIRKVPANVKKLRPHAVEMTPRLLAAWRHYRECKAVGRFPDDPLVRANAVQFLDAETYAAEDRGARREERLVEAILAAIPKRR